LRATRSTIIRYGRVLGGAEDKDMVPNQLCSLACVYPNIFLPVLTRMKGMSNPIYIRCPNPKCYKLNPIQPDESERGKEHTCVFCGFIIAPEKTRKNDEDISSKSRGRNRRFPLQQSESKPVNRNTRKPTF
ncbi:MAG: hypothetical protein NTY03_11235, partial [Candidatus Bathyarchaeota archaeon]|nr:hypothetical protein [Candidatus Bathyarchaeota archaeon]